MYIFRILKFGLRPAAVFLMLRRPKRGDMRHLNCKLLPTLHGGDAMLSSSIISVRTFFVRCLLKQAALIMWLHGRGQISIFSSRKHTTKREELRRSIQWVSPIFLKVIWALQMFRRVIYHHHLLRHLLPDRVLLHERTRKAIFQVRRR